MKHISFDEAADRFISQSSSKAKIPGLALILNRKNKLCIKTYGYADVKNKIEVNRDTLFEIGSMSKAFTCLGILLLKNAGIVDLHEKVSTYIPWFQMFYIDKITGRKHLGELTLWQLMYHRSGIPFDSLSLRSKANGPEGLKLGVVRLMEKKLCFQPGERYLYASYNTNLLAYVIEAVTGSFFEEYMECQVLRPLGLNKTFLSSEQARKAGMLSEGYRYSFFKARRYQAPDFHANVAGGKMISCASDMGRWLQIQMGQVEIEEKFKRAIEESHIGQFVLPDDGESFLAAGWDVKREDNILKYRGLDPNYSSMIMIDENLHYGVCILSNMSTGSAYYIGENVLKAQKPTAMQNYKPDRMQKIDRFFASVFIIAFSAVLGMFLSVAVDTNWGDRAFVLPHAVYAGVWLIILGVLLYKIPSYLTDYHQINWRLVFEWSPPSVPAACCLFYICNIAALLLWCFR